MLCNYLVRTLQYFQKILNSLFCPQKVEKKNTQKSCSEKLKSTTFFPLTILTAKTAQTEEFMFQNVAFRPTVYRTGYKTQKKRPSHSTVLSITYLPNLDLGT